MNQPITTRQNFDLAEFRALEGDKLNSKYKVVSRSVENIVEKGENAGYQHFLLFPQCF